MLEYLKTTGRIFDIQKYSIHDGPGIRTIVFLKGCALRCQWCCNPESQEFKIQTMDFAGKEKVVGRDVTVEEVMREVMKDLPYYRRSGGGMTLSGGEALLQPDFAVGLLKACHAEGVNTAIETTGFAPFETIERFLPHLDYVLMDIKQVDDAKHQRFTGQSNKLILENARKIAEWGANLTIRVPVIPGFNNTIEEIRKIAQFAASLPGVQHLHLLPYHRMGEDKYRALGREYKLAGIEPMQDSYMEGLLEAAERSGLHCQIGG
ncbi:MAG TPA: glycyl-radical enzyme activating protein [Candidatus Avimonoglobus intestinipullorum]|uniref:Glycyl-radical enzyme activating protein n=1 Tax=Candidatus Avimonoglobus intestinipullorum TaxID=2840699 RepID=A0A9D1LV01_9FIRM|nr:glycyl-radical enzyme activating protein [Candidatus Avimonoglobus intestinipullorum]